mgnify:CR=1 FL=1|tara:strand:- start:721 stop:1125 length:405 start_codon:yes stop_codon:yes gene_type:complete
MKDTYLRIFSNAKQLVGLPAFSAAEIANLENAATTAVNNLLEGGICCGDGNENAPTYNSQPGDTPGYACCSSGDFIEFEGGGMPGGGGFTYEANGWLYPYDIDNQMFVVGIQDLGGNVFYVCNSGGGHHEVHAG